MKFLLSLVMLTALFLALDRADMQARAVQQVVAIDEYVPDSATLPAENAPMQRPSGPEFIGYTPKGFQMFEGPRGGVYHWSKNGKKVYQRR